MRESRGATALSEDGCRGYGRVIINEEYAAREAEATVSKRRGGSILRDTSRLMRSVKHQAKGSSVYVGSHLVYALIHQKEAVSVRAGA